MTINDQSQRLQAIDYKQSFIVQAPAGSGKTELLIQRYLCLLAKVSSPQEILAITFTKKAANEMRERILGALNSARHSEPKEAHKQLTWRLAREVLSQDAAMKWDILNNPNQLKILTIDSFCSQLTRQLPILSHFGSQPDISDYPVAMYREAVQEVLMHVNEDLGWSDSIARVLLYLDNDIRKFEKLLIKLLEKRDQWLSHIHSSDNSHEIKKILENNIAKITSEHLKSLINIFPASLQDDLTALLTYCSNSLGKDACLDKTELFKSDAELISSWKLVANILLKADGEWRKQADSKIGFIPLNKLKNAEEKSAGKEYRAIHKEIIARLSQHENIKEALHSLTFLPDSGLENVHIDILVDLILILKVLTAQLRLTFQKYGAIDFCQNSLAALEALGSEDNPTDLALSLDYKIKHILIDEFQDTSSTQFSLLKKLIAGWQADDDRTVFIVGDPMQSIYRFREAEVGLFLRMWNSGINQLNLKPLSLTVNFRSTDTIVNQNNQFFAKIFPEVTHIPSGAVNFSPSIAANIKEQTAGESHVQIKGFKTSDDSLQANYIVDVIKENSDRHPQDSIAILVKSRSHLNSIIPALKAADIPYQALDIDPLEQRQYIQDIYSLCRALLHLNDRIAWLAILRAPWCGLKLDDLLVIANQSELTIWEALNNQDIQKQVSANGKNRLANIIPVLSQALTDHSRYSFRYWIERCWILLGGPATLSNEVELCDTVMFFKLLDKQASNNVLFSAENLKDSLSRLYAEPDSQQAVVQLMTIHSSKGLEFDTVIIPHIEKKSRHDEKSLLTWMDYPLSNNQIATLLAPLHSLDKNNSLYDFIANQNKIKTRNEADRLLYVATTRSKKRLYLSFNIKDQDEIKASNCWLEKLLPFINKNDITDAVTSQSAEISVEALNTNNLQRLTDNWTNLYSVNKNTEFRKHQTYQGFHLLSQHDHISGSAIHLILQRLSEDGFDWWQTLKPQDKNKYLTAILLSFNAPMHEIANQRQFIEECINKTLTDEKGRWILEQKLHASCEYALTYKQSTATENLIIDKTFVCENNYRWIIDYKTSRKTNDGLATFIDQEKKKYFDKMALYARAMNHLDERHIKCGLYFPAISAWVEWEASC